MWKVMIRPWISWCSFPNLWFLLVEETWALVSWPGLKMSVKWQPVSLDSKLNWQQDGLSKGPLGSGWPPPDDNIRGRGAHLLVSLSLCPHMLTSLSPSEPSATGSCGLGRAEGQLIHWREDGHSEWQKLPYSQQLSSHLCHPLRL